MVSCEISRTFSPGYISDFDQFLCWMLETITLAKEIIDADVSVVILLPCSVQYDMKHSTQYYIENIQEVNRREYGGGKENTDKKRWYAEALKEMIVGRGKRAPVPVECPRSGSDVHVLHRKANKEVRYIGQHCYRVPRYVMALGPGMLCQREAVEIP